MKIFISIFILIFSLSSFAQDSIKTKPVVVQFSGLVVTGDSAFGLPYVHVYEPKSRRGTETNEMGYFTMPALAGDSIVIKHLGFHKKYVILPDGQDKQSYTYIIELNQDTTVMADITIMPYPTFQLFKQAFVKVELPQDENMNHWEKNMRKEDLEKMMFAMAPSSYETYRTYSLQEIQKIENNNMLTGGQVNNPLLNLFAWVNLINELSVKAKERKKQKEKDAFESDF